MMNQRFEIEMPDKVDGDVLKGIVDVLLRRNYDVEVSARGAMGRPHKEGQKHRLVLDCRRRRKDEQQ